MILLHCVVCRFSGRPDCIQRVAKLSQSFVRQAHEDRQFASAQRHVNGVIATCIGNRPFNFSHHRFFQRARLLSRSIAGAARFFQDSQALQKSGRLGECWRGFDLSIWRSRPWSSHPMATQTPATHRGRWQGPGRNLETGCVELPSWETFVGLTSNSGIVFRN